MNWNHIRWIFTRELKDQLRDRRTLFMITVLPIVLYPLMGMLMLQVAQFSREAPVRVKLLGSEHLPSDPPLIDKTSFAIRKGLETTVSQIALSLEQLPVEYENSQLVDTARSRIKNGEADLIVIVEPRFRDYLSDLTRPAQETNASSPATGESGRKSQQKSSADESTIHDHGLTVVMTRGRDQSQIASRRWALLLDAWQRDWVSQQLKTAGISPALVKPIETNTVDIAPEETRRAIVWSKILPFVMLIWALTGAFYPAVDLCAGEKERGTLETLLSSPARRREIVWGKLLTVMVFSGMTSLLNIASMQFTATMLARQLTASGARGMADALGSPPIHALGWLLLILPPMAALFSALALAVAAFARSTKEGQYYLMPLLLVTLPLVMLPILPGSELSLGTAFVPVTGVVLLARSLVEGQYAEAIRYLPIVTAVTAVCCLLAIRWAVRQFESESVMFRENERYDVRMLLHYLWQGRGEVATVPEAILCGVLILVARFFSGVVANPAMDTWPALIQGIFISQVVIILTPCLLMAIILTRRFQTSLRLRRPKAADLLLAGGLALSLHPTYTWLASGIQQIYPIPSGVGEVLLKIDSVVREQPLWSVLIALALIPAICEELAFRGFIFGGLARENGTLRAILLSALFFGFSHGVLQQQISASVMGLVLGWLAWRTGGVACSMMMHVVHNSLSISLPRVVGSESHPDFLNVILEITPEGFNYTSGWTLTSIALSMLIVWAIYLRSIERLETDSIPADQCPISE